MIPQDSFIPKGGWQYNPEGKRTKYYNQKYSGSMYSEFDFAKETQQKRLEQRAKSYDKWAEAEHQVSREQQNQDPRSQIGAVSSSWLTSLGYNVATSEAVATFKGSSAEFYYKMSYETFLNWLNSPSKGRWLHDHPGIMESYSKRGGAGRQRMETRLRQFYKTDRTRTRSKNYMARWQ